MTGPGDKKREPGRTVPDLAYREAQNGRDCPKGMQALVVLPLLADFLIVLLFLTTVFNVSLGAPLDTPRVRS